MKRGSVTDTFYYGALAFGLIIFTLVILFVVHAIQDSAYPALATLPGITTQNLDILNQTGLAVNNFAETVPIVVGVGSMGIIGAAALQVIPAIFLPFGIILFIVTVVFFFQVQLVAPNILSNPIFAVEVAQYPILGFILTHIAWIVLVVGAIILVVLYRGMTVNRSNFGPGG